MKSDIHSFSAERQPSAKPIYPDLSSDAFHDNSKKQYRNLNPSAPNFEDIQLDRNNQPTASPSVQRKSTKAPHMNREHPADENVFDGNRQGSTADNESDGVVYLLNATEQLTVCHSVLCVGSYLFLSLGEKCTRFHSSTSIEFTRSFGQMFVHSWQYR